MVLANHIAVAADKGPVAVRTVGVLIFFHAPWQIPGIDEIQPGLVSDLSRAQQRFRGCILRVGHLVVFVKGCHMPGDIRGNGTQETGRLEQFLVAVIKSGHDQCYNFHPRPDIVRLLDGIQHVFENPAQAAVIFILHRL